jgi:hypothetical protein
LLPPFDSSSERGHRLELDSGVQRFAAHRFYFRERMWISRHHFSLELNDHDDTGNAGVKRHGDTV